MNSDKKWQHYRWIKEILDANGMSVEDLAEIIERVTGKFVDDKRLRQRLRFGRFIWPWVWHEIVAIMNVLRAHTGDEGTYFLWKYDLNKKGKTPEDLLTQYEAAGMTDYVKQVRSLIQRMEGSATELCP